ncbi:MAG: phosphopentomutase [Nitrospinota bacterium]
MDRSRVVLIILDGFGVGELPDAGEYKDAGTNTLGNISKRSGGIALPNLERMGLGCIGDFEGIRCVKEPMASFGRMAEKSKGKDTTTGHWELMGLVPDKAFPLYPDGFPPDIMEPFKKAIKREILWNRPASGTEIIERLGREHIKTGFPIIYTSADSVFQIAAHEEIIHVDDLYHMCEIARGILRPPCNVCRVIARPFAGKPGSFVRTERRRDYSVEPFRETTLDNLRKNNINVIGIGKIEDIFAGKGIAESIHTKENEDGINKTLYYLEKIDKGLIFINLNDFDTKYGHRNNIEGYADALKVFDARLPEIWSGIKRDDLLIITSDHGCDPTTPGTDHSREYVPLLVYGKMIKGGINLGTRETFADVGETIAGIFGVKGAGAGKSFLKL